MDGLDDEDRKERVARRLGAPRLAECPQCGRRFRVGGEVFTVMVLLDGEVSARPEDELDDFCSFEHAQTYADEARRRATTRYDFGVVASYKSLVGPHRSYVVDRYTP